MSRTLAYWELQKEKEPRESVQRDQVHRMAHDECFPATYPGAVLDALQRRPMNSNRKKQTRRVPACEPALGSQPLHMYGKMATRRWTSMRVTPKSSTCSGG